MSHGFRFQKGNKFALKHGLRHHSAYNTWAGIMDRCHNPKSTNWKNYGGRGIAVCKRWHSLKNFISDMGERPPRMSIDRINNNKNYSPGNCRWASRRTQNNNTGQNVRIKYRGEDLTLAEWAERLGVSPFTLYSRKRYGWSDRKILETPIRAW